MSSRKKGSNKANQKAQSQPSQSSQNEPTYDWIPPPPTLQLNIKSFVYQEKTYNWLPLINEFFEKLKQKDDKFVTKHQELLDCQPFIDKFIFFYGNDYIGGISSYICLLFCTLMKQKGGMLNVLARNKFQDVTKEFERIFQIEANVYSTQLYFEIYKAHVLSYQMKQEAQLAKAVPVNIGRIRYFTTQQLDMIIKNDLEEKQFNRDVFVIKRFAEYVKFNEQILSPQFFASKYGELKVDVRIERGESMRRVLETNSMGTDIKMKFSEFLEYQELEGRPEAKKLPMWKHVKAGHVCYAYNIDALGKDEFQKQLASKLGKTIFFQYLGPRDALSHLEGWIPGCNSPQLYVMVEGACIGGRQQKVALTTSFVNMGPDSCEWYTLGVEDVPRLRKQVLSQYHHDIYSDDGIWFGQPKWFITNEYPIKKFYQKQGDLVYLGPGTMYWVKSLGNTFLIAWNKFQKTQKQWRCALERTRINHQIGYYNIFMPLKSLAISILNHECREKSPFTHAVQLSVIEWLKEEAQDIQNFKKVNKGYFPKPTKTDLKDIDSLCEICRQEILTTFASDEEGERLICLKCCLKQPDRKKLKFFKKTNLEDIAELFSLMKRQRSGQDLQEDIEREALCKAHCGTTHCEKLQMGRTYQHVKNVKRRVLKKPESKLSPEMIVERRVDGVEQQLFNRERQLKRKQMQREKESQVAVDNVPSSNEQVAQIKDSSYQKSKNKEANIFHKCSPNPKMPKIDALQLLKLLHEAMPKASWSKDEVIESQILVLKDKGYIKTDSNVSKDSPSSQKKESLKEESLEEESLKVKRRRRSIKKRKDEIEQEQSQQEESESEESEQEESQSSSDSEQDQVVEEKPKKTRGRKKTTPNNAAVRGRRNTQNRGKASGKKNSQVKKNTPSKSQSKSPQKKPKTKL